MSTIQKQQTAILQMLRVLYPQLSNVPDQEVLKAVAVAKKMGLDILEEVHFVPYANRVQIVISYETYLRRAIKASLVEWWKVDVGEDTIGGTYAEVVIKRRDWQELFTWRVYLNEAKKDNRAWKEMPLTMLRKTAIAQGFRLCFPDVLNVDFEIKEEVEVVEGKVEEEEEVITDKQRRYLWVKAKEKGLTEEELKNIIKQFNYESTKDIKRSDFSAIMKYIELYTQER